MGKYRRVPHWKQRSNHYTCGPVCLRMVLSYLDGRLLSSKDYHRLLKLTMDGNPMHEKGTLRRRMRSVVRSLGYSYALIRGKNELHKALKLGPVIAFCNVKDEDGETYKHYVVLSDKTEKYYLINDPCKNEPGKILQNVFLGRRGDLYWRKEEWGIRIFKA